MFTPFLKGAAEMFTLSEVMDLRYLLVQTSLLFYTLPVTRSKSDLRRLSYIQNLLAPLPSVPKDESVTRAPRTQHERDVTKGESERYTLSLGQKEHRIREAALSDNLDVRPTQSATRA